ncbi:MAG: YfhO family protein [Ferruginibacter sp.]
MQKKLFVNPFTIFFASAAVFFWPISLFLFTLKNDALTYYYPVRTLISDAIRNGELPLWTPFINMGYPLHADMQSGAWNPVIWIFSFLSNYSLAAFHCELLFYIALAGIGFYYLCRQLGCSKTTAYTISFAYQFSGFMIDSVQFFTCISAASYIPWVLLFFRRMTIQYKMVDALGLAFFLFLLFTGGYPSLFIITAYVLAAYFLFSFLSNKNRWDFLKKIIAPASIACLFFLLLSLPALISFIQHLPLIGRGKSQTLAFVLENSMHPVTLISLISPFATTANDAWLNSSILMRSIYIGIMPLLFLVSAFFNKQVRRNKEMRFFFGCSLVMITMAWGEFFFLRQAAYYTLPLMDSFRHPALFRLFGIVFLLLISASAMKEWENDKETKKLFFKKAITAALILTVIAGIFCAVFLNNKIHSADITAGNFKNLMTQFNFQQRYLIQIPLLILTLCLSYFAFVKRKSRRMLVLITIADLFFATQLNIPVTVIGSKRFNEVEKQVNRNPVKFPVPGKESIEENSKNTSGENVITGSSLPYIKKIGRNDYFISPGNLSLQDSFYESGIKDIVFKNPVLYLSDSIIESPSSKTSARDQPDFFGGKIFISNGSRDKDKINIQSFSANELKANIVTQGGGLLVYLQNNYPGWEVLVDEKKQNIHPVNICFMGFYIPAGTHEIHLKYRPLKIIIAWYISAGSFIIGLVWLTILFLKKRNQRSTEGEME